MYLCKGNLYHNSQSVTKWFRSHHSFFKFYIYKHSYSLPFCSLFLPPPPPHHHLCLFVLIFAPLTWEPKYSDWPLSWPLLPPPLFPIILRWPCAVDRSHKSNNCLLALYEQMCFDWCDPCLNLTFASLPTYNLKLLSDLLSGPLPPCELRNFDFFFFFFVKLSWPLTPSTYEQRCFDVTSALTFAPLPPTYEPRNWLFDLCLDLWPLFPSACEQRWRQQRVRRWTRTWSRCLGENGPSPLSVSSSVSGMPWSRRSDAWMSLMSLW